MQEKLVNSQLSAHLDDNKRLHCTQSGFCPSPSIETALLEVSEVLKNAQDRGKSAELILLDLSAAFKTVFHPTLLQSPTEVGIGGIGGERTRNLSHSFCVIL